MHFSGKPGDQVVFRKAGRSPVIWTVKEIKMDPEDCNWDRKKRKPFFIHLKTEKSRNKSAQSVWACGSDLTVISK